MAWLQLTVEAQADDAEAVEQWLNEWGALAVTFEDAADNPLFEPPLNTTPLWQTTRITGLFAEETDAEMLRRQADRHLPASTLARVEDQDWVRVWLTDFQPMRFGQHLWICPAGLPAPDPQAIRIDLDPGLAFGTGTHPTTALCLTWLDQQREHLTGRTVLDYGCGSGVLAIAALKLGAARASGNDIDPQALIASRDNAEKNQVDLTLFPADQTPAESFDLVVANILANPLIALAPVISQHVAPGGDLVLSGILETQVEAVRAAYDAEFTWQKTAIQAGWARLWGQRLEPDESSTCPPGG